MPVSHHVKDHEVAIVLLKMISTSNKGIHAKDQFHVNVQLPPRDLEDPIVKYLEVFNPPKETELDQYVDNK